MDPEFTSSDLDRKFEFENVDLDKLVFEINNYLEKNDKRKDFDYAPLELPENKGICFKFSYGMNEPNFTYYITLERIENKLNIFNHIPSNYYSWAKIRALPNLENHRFDFIPSSHKLELWTFIVQTAKSLEN